MQALRARVRTCRPSGPRVNAQKSTRHVAGTSLRFTVTSIIREKHTGEKTEKAEVRVFQEIPQKIFLEILQEIPQEISTSRIRCSVSFISSRRSCRRSDTVRSSLAMSRMDPA